MNVTRQRRRVAKVRLGLFGRRVSRRIRILTVGTAALAVAGGGLAYASTDAFGTHKVGETTDQGLLLPSDQVIDPVGDRLLVDNGKLLSSTVSPDGHHLAALTNDRSIALTIVDLDDYKILQQVGTSSAADLRISSNNVGQEGPTYSPDGKFLWMPQIDGFTRFPVNADGTVSTPTSIPIPAQGSKRALPAQLGTPAPSPTSPPGPQPVSGSRRRKSRWPAEQRCSTTLACMGSRRPSSRRLVRCPRQRPSAFACTRTTPSGCWPDQRSLHGSARSPHWLRNASTAPGITAA